MLLAAPSDFVNVAFKIIVHHDSGRHRRARRGNSRPKPSNAFSIFQPSSAFNIAPSRSSPSSPSFSLVHNPTNAIAVAMSAAINSSIPALMTPRAPPMVFVGTTTEFSLRLKASLSETLDPNSYPQSERA
jgi:hypothetical protein